MLKLLSPAKLNLFLKVVKRREDGYHDLASLFQTIDLYDTLHFELADNDVLTCDVSDIPTDRTNLILKAADVFRKKTGIAFGLHVKLEKKIPSQSGLGGGSSNAAATLWAINSLLNRPVSPSDLRAWSSEVGSDVPFFFSQGTAFCTGRGEHVQNLEPLPKSQVVIVKPTAGLSTPSVFGQLNLSSLNPVDQISILTRFMEGQPSYVNDLEEPAFSAMPELRLIKQTLLQSGYDTVLMTGSGSAFFCLGEGTFPKDFPFVVQANFTNRSADSWYG